MRLTLPLQKHSVKFHLKRLWKRRGYVVETRTMVPEVIKAKGKSNSSFIFKVLLDQGGTGILCFGLRMTLPLRFKARVDSSLPALCCYLCTTVARVISGCQNRPSNPDHSPVRQALNLTVKKCIP